MDALPWPRRWNPEVVAAIRAGEPVPQHEAEARVIAREMAHPGALNGLPIGAVLICASRLLAGNLQLLDVLIFGWAAFVLCRWPVNRRDQRLAERWLEAYSVR